MPAIICRQLSGARIEQRFDVRRVEIVGPQVSAELIQTGIMACGRNRLNAYYIWFRFEWQFSVGAVLALVHDVALTIGCSRCCT